LPAQRGRRRPRTWKARRSDGSASAHTTRHRLTSRSSPKTRPIQSSWPPPSTRAARPAGTRTPARPSSSSPRERSPSTTATTRRARRTSTGPAPASSTRASGTCTSPATRAPRR